MNKGWYSDPYPQNADIVLPTVMLELLALDKFQQKQKQVVLESLNNDRFDHISIGLEASNLSVQAVMETNLKKPRRLSSLFKRTD